MSIWPTQRQFRLHQGLCNTTEKLLHIFKYCDFDSQETSNYFNCRMQQRNVQVNFKLIRVNIGRMNLREILKAITFSKK